MPIGLYTPNYGPVWLVVPGSSNVKTSRVKFISNPLLFAKTTINMVCITYTNIRDRGKRYDRPAVHAYRSTQSIDVNISGALQVSYYNSYFHAFTVNLH